MPSTDSQTLLKRRYRRILRFAMGVLAQSWWFELVLPVLGLSIITKKTRIKRFRNAARKFRLLAVDLTGLMIKVGQFFSSRLDVLPIEITRELEGLQDDVPPEPFELIKVQIESSLGMPLEVAFEGFNQTPLAAASLGQAHSATLTAKLRQISGHSKVVVKVLRPGIEQIVEVDLRALRKISLWLSRVKLVSRRVDAPSLIEEFAETTYQEIDYLNEASNLVRFRANFEGDEIVDAPSVVWDRTSKSVLTLSDVSTIKINDVDALIAAGINPNAVAGEFARIMFQQIFVHGFFHADPHPGNVFVAKDSTAPNGFKITFIDFGMMGVVTKRQQQDLRAFLFAVANRDAKAWVSSVEKLKLLLPSADKRQLEQAIELLFERFGGLAVSDLIETDPRELAKIALQFSDLVRSLPFQVPENFLMLVRAISLVSGVTSSLNRDFNIWDALDPFARALLKQGSGGFFKVALDEATSSLKTLISLPRRIESALASLEKGDLSIRNDSLEKKVARLSRSNSRLSYALVFAVFFGSAIFLRSQDDDLANWLFAGSTLPLLVAMISKRPS